jgi:hypothetical protein
VTFESLRHQVSHFVHEAREPLTFAKLREVCDMAADDKQLANTIFQMCKYRELVRHPAPTGAGMGVRHAYGPGKNKPGAAPQENAAGGGNPKTERAKPARRARGSHHPGASRHPSSGRGKRSHGVRKVQRRNAASRGRGQRGNVRNTHISVPAGHVTPMWALRADGAFVLLGDEPGLVVPRPVAQALIEFVRKLDKGRA